MQFDIDPMLVMNIVNVQYVDLVTGIVSLVPWDQCRASFSYGELIESDYIKIFSVKLNCHLFYFFGLFILLQNVPLDNLSSINHRFAGLVPSHYLKQF